ncbi:helix-turn-helix domain-containing protein [Nostoc sp. CHAB 5784]|uniref:IS630 transposase-related protein n=1 Tax=Nostoc mirabile TaxID=2907820 RepID=UPI001E42D0B8|nr:IS630 transposase-related protein [Nostoc mirabile]MCC5669337.1 helix-turn-helix domain-containing protein [Nostoc mirabile CHAB5784]
MKAYSLDLRQKVVDAYACGDISQRKLAKNFGVTLSFVQNLLKRHRELGTISAKVLRHINHINRPQNGAFFWR